MKRTAKDKRDFEQWKLEFNELKQQDEPEPMEFAEAKNIEVCYLDFQKDTGRSF